MVERECPKVLCKGEERILEQGGALRRDPCDVEIRHARPDRGGDRVDSQI